MQTSKRQANEYFYKLRPFKTIGERLKEFPGERHMTRMLERPRFFIVDGKPMKNPLGHGKHYAGHGLAQDNRRVRPKAIRRNRAAVKLKEFKLAHNLQ